MNKFNKLLSLLVALCLIIVCVTGCKGKDNQTGENGNVDYVAETKLSMDSSTKKQEVTVKSYIDGDTTHFFVPTDISADGTLKARYMGVNTPESTGKSKNGAKQPRPSPRKSYHRLHLLLLNPITKIGTLTQQAAAILFGYGINLPIQTTTVALI